MPFRNSLSPTADSLRRPNICECDSPAAVSVNLYSFGDSGDQNSYPAVGRTTSPVASPDASTLSPSAIS